MEHHSDISIQVVWICGVWYNLNEAVLRISFDMDTYPE